MTEFAEYKRVLQADPLAPKPRPARLRRILWTIGVIGVLLLLIGVWLHPAWRYVPYVGHTLALLGFIMAGIAYFGLMTSRRNPRHNDPTKHRK